MNVKTVAAITGAIILLAILAKQQGGEIVEAVGEVNKGTPYEGAGVIGTLGNIVNKASGGTLAKFGSWLGMKVLP